MGPHLPRGIIVRDVAVLHSGIVIIIIIIIGMVERVDTGVGALRGVTDLSDIVVRVLSSEVCRGEAHVHQHGHADRDGVFTVEGPRSLRGGHKTHTHKTHTQNTQNTHVKHTHTHTHTNM